MYHPHGERLWDVCLLRWTTELMKYNSRRMLFEAARTHPYHSKDCQSRSHFATPYNFHERIEFRVVCYQIIIDAMDDQGQVKSVERPSKGSG
jgi:hypothetical protein